MKYNFQEVEKKWQKIWLDGKTFEAKEKSKKKKYYQLETFPYPSAAGLHVGHPKGYIAEDIHARYMRMKGHNVLYTMGWDAFGLPTENYAIKVGKSPQEVAAANIANFKRQVRMFGLSYDWDREINTSSPEYYTWTQWLFLELYKKSLAYRGRARVNWCPKDQTVLANEQVILKVLKNDPERQRGITNKSETKVGVCERCETPVEQREMEQWFLKITDYAERLIEGLDGLDWPEATVKRQLDWIGKSEGAMITFPLRKIPGQSDGAHSVEVFTTRPDTLFGATFLVISPELAEKWIGVGWKASDAVKDYIKKSLTKTELDRLENVKEKSGIDAGIVAVNPATKEEIPVWIADYVLGSYGTGAIMAVPAHDERDFEFAKKYMLPIKMVICPHYPAKTCPVLDHAYIGDGHLVDSGKFDGTPAQKAKWEITKAVGGKKKTQYKIRDWSVSRQRYWGVPIPMIHCPTCGIVPVPEKDLPVELPDLKDYRPQGLPPLASSEDFMNVKCPKCKGDAKRDAETLDTFVDSSWYFLRYTDPHNVKEAFDKKMAAYWMPVDLYVIGAEHTVLHLLYSRFITKFFYDAGHIAFEEPFKRLEHVGLILGADGLKMSKSKGNVVNPDELITEFGADALRVYEMFMGPFNDGQPWDPKGVIGAERFLRRFYAYMDGVIRAPGTTGTVANAAIHRTVKKIGEDIESFKFNTAIAALMILLRDIEENPIAKDDAELVIKIFHPFAPHMASELWEMLGKKKVLDTDEWPEWDPALIKEDTVELIVQVDGRVRDRMSVPQGISEGDAKASALARDAVKRWTEGKIIDRVIFVPNRLINICLKK